MGRPKKVKPVEEVKGYTPAVETINAAPLKLDLGCGKNKKGPDFIGVDYTKFEGVDVEFNLARRMVGNGLDTTKPLTFKGEQYIFAKWPWADNSVDEVHCSHFIEHLNAPQRIHFINELYRVMKVGAKATIMAPLWSSRRAYGDLDHTWPPVSDFWFYYLDRGWRESQAPHDNFYDCNFSIQWGFVLSQSPALNLQHRNDEYKNWAQNHLINAAEDVVATFTKVP